MLLIYNSTKLIKLAALSELPTIELSNSWNGTVSPHSLKIVVAKDPLWLHFLAKGQFTAWVHEDSKLAQFREGLAERDLAELFLVEPSGKYIEVHISPRGAWWLCDFSAPRQRIHPHGFECPSIVENSHDIHGWSAAVSIRIEDLPITFDLLTLRGNLSACIGPAPREYLSLVTLPGERPNFHQPDKFTPITAMDLSYL